jgi:hypothetical protein
MDSGRPICSCGKVLARKSRTGLCVECRRAHFNEPKICTCGKKLHRYNKSGFCQPCITRRNNQRPEDRAKKAEAMRAVWQRPGYREQISEKLSAENLAPDVREGRRQRAIETGLAQRGHTAMRVPEVRARTNRRIAQTKAPWCPPHLLDDARKMRRSGFKASEIKAILADHEAREVERVRAKFKVKAKAKVDA